MTESKAREFCKHNIHESHYCGSCNRDTINKLQAEIKAKDELLKEFIDVASDVVGMEMRTYGRLSNTSGLGSSISILNSFIEKLREGKL